MPRLGKAFFDNLSFVRYKPRLSSAQWRGWGARETLLYFLLILGFFALAVRLFHLTIVQGRQNRLLSEENRIREGIIHAGRGIFFDRREQALVENIPAFRVSYPCETDTLCPTQLVKATDLPKEISAADIFYESDYVRWYLYPQIDGHVLGYLGEITREELNNPYYIYQTYLLGDRIGRSGLEQTFEKKLRGIDGKELIEVDAKGNKIRTLGKIEDKPGEDVFLALDQDLQHTAYEAMEGLPGAVIVSKPKTGEILVLLSSPSFDVNKFHTGLSQKKFQELNNLGRPLFNRAISGVYPPGSTFKPIVAIAGLESGKISSQTTFEDTGVLTIGAFSFSNWFFNQYGQTDGWVDLVKGIARSNDIFFYKVGETVGPETIADWGKKFGIGSKTGIELPAEAEGLMPDPVWRSTVKGQDWYLGDTYHLAIGQGELQTTPLQVNLWTNVIASGGMLCQPTLLKSPVFAAKTGMSDLKSQNCRDLGLNKKTIEIITEGMRRACYKAGDGDYSGTGWPLFDFSITQEKYIDGAGMAQKKDIPVACKTGTAEFGDPQGKTHAWFTVFAPVPASSTGSNSENQPELSNQITGDPEIAVTVLVEEGGEGSTVAAPIAKKILSQWFSR